MRHASGFLALWAPLFVATPLWALPDEPLAIGHSVQFVFDGQVIDNHWAEKRKTEHVRRVFHAPVKHDKNPVIGGQGGYVCVAKDAESGLLRMWYQVSVWEEAKRRASYAIAYAESKDGLDWKLPRLGLCTWKGTRDNNIVLGGDDERRASSPFLLDVPEEARRGFRYLMLHSTTEGLCLIGSQDGIHWDPASYVNILRIHSDTDNAIVYDPARREYVLFCRPKHIYVDSSGRTGGACRRVARSTSKDLWSGWNDAPQTILVPDEADADRGFLYFYGMPTRYFAGVYWGFLWPFKLNTDIVTDLVTSRDGIHFDRLPGRPPLVGLGPEGAWDDGMAFASPLWVEMGDQWWIYYAGHDGPHESRDRHAGIGLARVRKEGLISMRGPEHGGVLVTRRLIWPGGKLLVNADASQGELRVRVTDARRRGLEGLDWDDCQAITGDGLRQPVAWKAASLDSLAGREIRLEFFVKNADLYTFLAE